MNLIVIPTEMEIKAVSRIYDNIYSTVHSHTFPDNPDVIPLQVTGTIDTDLSKVTVSEMMAWGLANLWKEGKEGGYSVRHGRQPVSDFGRPRRGEVVAEDRENFFEKAFPCLFPYGRGGPEADRPEDVRFGDHIRYALRYHD